MDLLPDSNFAAPPTPNVAKSPSTAPTLAISPPSPVSPASASSSVTPAAPSAQASNAKAPVAKTPAASMAATLAVSPASPVRPPRTVTTVAPVPEPPAPSPVRRSSGKGLIVLGLASLTSMAIAAVLTVLYHSPQVAPSEESTSAEVTEAPAPVSEPEAPPSPEETSADPEPEATNSPAIALPDLPDIFGDADQKQEQNQEEQAQSSDRSERDRPERDRPERDRPERSESGSQLPTDATIRSVPGFSPGTREQEVVGRLGEPGEVREDGNGLRTAVYVFPEQVDLVYIYNQQGRLQQSEAYFAPYMDFNVMRIALNGMLGNRLRGDIEQGLEDVRRGQASSVPIETDRFQGVIENTGDRIYVGVWRK